MIDRIASGVEPLDLTNNPPLEFYAPDLDKFTCLRQAFDALKQGGNAMVFVRHRRASE
jgi:1-deoxy-D-xylulose-5-phosphate reductoisomerase